MKITADHQSPYTQRQIRNQAKDLTYDSMNDPSRARPLAMGINDDVTRDRYRIKDPARGSNQTQAKYIICFYMILIINITLFPVILWHPSQTRPVLEEHGCVKNKDGDNMIRISFHSHNNKCNMSGGYFIDQPCNINRNDTTRDFINVPAKDLTRNPDENVLYASNRLKVTSLTVYVIIAGSLLIITQEAAHYYPPKLNLDTVNLEPDLAAVREQNTLYTVELMAAETNLTLVLAADPAQDNFYHVSSELSRTKQANDAYIDPMALHTSAPNKDSAKKRVNDPMENTLAVDPLRFYLDTSQETFYITSCRLAACTANIERELNAVITNNALSYVQSGMAAETRVLKADTTRDTSYYKSRDGFFDESIATKDNMIEPIYHHQNPFHHQRSKGPAEDRIHDPNNDSSRNPVKDSGGDHTRDQIEDLARDPNQNQPRNIIRFGMIILMIIINITLFPVILLHQAIESNTNAGVPVPYLLQSQAVEACTIKHDIYAASIARTEKKHVALHKLLLNQFAVLFAKCIASDAVQLELYFIDEKLSERVSIIEANKQLFHCFLLHESRSRLLTELDEKVQQEADTINGITNDTKCNMAHQYDDECYNHTSSYIAHQQVPGIFYVTGTRNDGIREAVYESINQQAPNIIYIASVDNDGVDKTIYEFFADIFH